MVCGNLRVKAFEENNYLEKYHINLNLPVKIVYLYTI